ncbi:hypothetical protein HR12_27845 [Microbacterium sp. SUBG005]|nr:hypothetical protein HR12_27845 [Microbacterium sp. SUBG005]
MAAHGHNVTTDHVHTHAAPGNIRHAFCGGKSRGENQHPYVLIAEGVADIHSLGAGFREDFLPVQSGTIISHLNDDIAAMMFRREDKIAHYRLPLTGTFFFLLNAVIETVTHQMSQWGR